MNRINKFLTMTLTALIFLPGAAQAMPIQQFDKMSRQDQADYLTVLIDGAQKVLIERGMNDDAAKIHKLFTEKLPGESVPLGMVEFDRNLDRARVADLKRVAEDPNATRLEVEHAMVVTLRKNGIDLPKTFITVAKDFKPKHPAQDKKE